ncbi:MAG: DNA-binding response regulator [Moraxellaceae bacterium]|nr:MAG: DNA-binding response regulator [Moraxellaceae bacterium]
MKVLVCDDERLARERIARLIVKMEDHEVVGEAENGIDTIDKVAQLAPDIVLLDIRMPGMDGLEAARHLSKLECPPAVIFCTAYDEYALDAFQVKAVDYLLKPVRSEDLCRALNQASRLNKVQALALEEEFAAKDDKPRSRTHISAKTHRGIELIPVTDVRYFMADQKYVTVRHGSGEILIDETLKELEEEFSNRFVRIHRNSLVALDYLDGMEIISPGHYKVKIKEVEDGLVVSRRHVSGLRRIMQRL